MCRSRISIMATDILATLLTINQATYPGHYIEETVSSDVKQYPRKWDRIRINHYHRGPLFQHGSRQILTAALLQLFNTESLLLYQMNVMAIQIINLCFSIIYQLYVLS